MTHTSNSSSKTDSKTKRKLNNAEIKQLQKFKDASRERLFTTFAPESSERASMLSDFSEKIIEKLQEFNPLSTCVDKFQEIESRVEITKETAKGLKGKKKTGQEDKTTSPVTYKGALKLVAVCIMEINSKKYSCRNLFGVDWPTSNESSQENIKKFLTDHSLLHAKTFDALDPQKQRIACYDVCHAILTGEAKFRLRMYLLHEKLSKLERFQVHSDITEKYSSWNQDFGDGAVTPGKNISDITNYEYVPFFMQFSDRIVQSWGDQPKDLKSMEKKIREAKVMLDNMISNCKLSNKDDRSLTTSSIKLKFRGKSAFKLKETLDEFKLYESVKRTSQKQLNSGSHPEHQQISDLFNIFAKKMESGWIKQEFNDTTNARKIMSNGRSILRSCAQLLNQGETPKLDYDSEIKSIGALIQELRNSKSDNLTNRPLFGVAWLESKDTDTITQHFGEKISFDSLPPLEQQLLCDQTRRAILTGEAKFRLRMYLLHEKLSKLERFQAHSDITEQYSSWSQDFGDGAVTPGKNISDITNYEYVPFFMQFSDRIVQSWGDEAKDLNSMKKKVELAKVELNYLISNCKLKCNEHSDKLSEALIIKRISSEDLIQRHKTIKQFNDYQLIKSDIHQWLKECLCNGTLALNDDETDDPKIISTLHLFDVFVSMVESGWIENNLDKTSKAKKAFSDGETILEHCARILIQGSYGNTDDFRTAMKVLIRELGSIIQPSAPLAITNALEKTEDSAKEKNEQGMGALKSGASKLPGVNTVGNLNQKANDIGEQATKAVTKQLQGELTSFLSDIATMSVPFLGGLIIAYQTLVSSMEWRRWKHRKGKVLAASKILDDSQLALTTSRNMLCVIRRIKSDSGWIATNNATALLVSIADPTHIADKPVKYMTVIANLLIRTRYTLTRLKYADKLNRLLIRDPVSQGWEYFDRAPAMACYLPFSPDDICENFPEHCENGQFSKETLGQEAKQNRLALKDKISEATTRVKTIVGIEEDEEEDEEFEIADPFEIDWTLADWILNAEQGQATNLSVDDKAGKLKEKIYNDEQRRALLDICRVAEKCRKKLDLYDFPVSSAKV